MSFITQKTAGEATFACDIAVGALYLEPHSKQASKYLDENKVNNNTGTLILV